MSNVLKSSQVIIDDSKFTISTVQKLYDNTKQKNIGQEKKENELKELERRKKEIEKIAKEKIEIATSEAEDIISNAYERSKGIMDQAKEQGYTDGKRLGFEEGKREADSLIKEALSIKNSLLDSKKNLLKDMEEEIVNLCINTIERILNKKIEEDTELILSLIQLGINQCAFTEKLIIRVSPEDYDYTISIKDKILALSENISEIEIKQDKSLAKGSCIVDTPSGSVDSSICTQFNYIKDIFEELLRGE